MKEVTYEDWLKNPTPRMMWIWDDKEENKIKRKVIYFVENKDVSHPVIVLSCDGTITASFKHCAEIENQRLMTHRELARWLSEKPFREFKYGRNTYCPIYSSHTYTEDEASKEVDKNILIRENDGEWKVPLIEEIK